MAAVGILNVIKWTRVDRTWLKYCCIVCILDTFRKPEVIITEVIAIKNYIKPRNNEETYLIQ